MDVSFGGSGGIPGIVFETGAEYWLRAQFKGSAPTEIRAKLWDATALEPEEWLAVATDDTQVLQTAGAVGFRFYDGGEPGHLPVSVTWDDLCVSPPDMELVSEPSAAM